MASVSLTFVNNTMLAVLDDLTDNDGNLVTTATVTITTIVDKNGDEVTGETYPISLAHIASGRYEGVVLDTLAVTQGKTYRATYKAVAGANIGEWEETLNARIRTA